MTHHRHGVTSAENISQDQNHAIVIGIQNSENSREEVSESLVELEELLRTLHVNTVARVIQSRARIVARTLIGSGKVEEVKELAAVRGAQMVVIDHELNPVQLRNLESLLGLKVTDRTGVILEIFSEHARTPQAKTQVEIAKLEYLLPRLTGAWTHFHRQKGGVNSRGMGETQIEVDRRHARERIVKLQRQLAQMRVEKKTQSRSRQNEIKVALVGYTNSGKTTVMNQLTSSNFKAKDELFATLDASIRVIDPRTRPKILLSDTVGFIRDLPHSLVESFKSTLDHVLDADLLLHVVDASSPHFRAHISTTESVLAEIGAEHIPTMVVFNKIDMIEDPFFGRIIKNSIPDSIVISAHRPPDIMRLREHVYQFFAKKMPRVHVRLSVAQKDLVSHIYAHCMVLNVDYDDQGYVVFEIQAAEASIARLRGYIVHPDQGIPPITNHNQGLSLNPHDTASFPL